MEIRIDGKNAKSGIETLAKFGPSNVHFKFASFESISGPMAMKNLLFANNQNAWLRDLFSPGVWDKILTAHCAFWLIVNLISLIALIMCNWMKFDTWMFPLSMLQLVSLVGAFPVGCFKALQLYRDIRLYHVWMSMLFLLYVLPFRFLMHNLPFQAFWQWSWLSGKSNTVLMGFDDFPKGMLNIAFLILCFPVLALVEECIFRNRTLCWKGALSPSFLFGLIHILSGTSIGDSAVTLTLLGLWLTREHFEGIRRQVISMTLERHLSRTMGCATMQEALKQVQKRDEWTGWNLGSLSIMSIASWSQPAVVVNWEHIASKTFILETRPSVEISTKDSLYWGSMDAGVRAATVLHLTYNLLCIFIMMTQLLFSNDTRIIRTE
jgi:hypothetical protein